MDVKGVMGGRWFGKEGVEGWAIGGRVLRGGC